MGLLDKLFGGGDKTGTTTTRPPKFVEDAQKKLLSSAGEQFDSGDIFNLAPEDPSLLFSRRLLDQLSRGGLQDLASNVTGTFDFLNDPSMLDPASNPFLQRTAEAAIRPIEESLLERILPSIRSGSIDAGQFGGSRGALAEAGSIRDFTRTAGDISSNIFSRARTEGLNTLLSALRLSPTVAQAQLLPATVAESVGVSRQNRAQQELDEPFTELQRFGQFVPSASGSTTTGPISSTNPLLGALGGAASGVAIGSAIPGLGPGFGAGIGALLGLLGSR